MSDALELATRALKHFNEGTTDLAPSQMRIPLSAYTDEQQYQVERQAVFFESPIAVALSLEIPEPGDFQTQTVMDIPLLMTRDRDGRVHCFINVCRHRGAKVCQAKKATNPASAALTTPGPTIIAARWLAFTGRRRLVMSIATAWASLSWPATKARASFLFA